MTTNRIAHTCPRVDTIMETATDALKDIMGEFRTALEDAVEEINNLTERLEEREDAYLEAVSDLESANETISELADTIRELEVRNAQLETTK